MIAGFAVSSGLTFVFTHYLTNHPAASLRVCQTLSVLLTFVLPAAYIIHRQGNLTWKHFTDGGSATNYLYGFIAWLTITPLVNLTDQWNHKLISFSDPFILDYQAGMETMMKVLSNYDGFCEGLLVFLIIAVLAAVAEEMFFRSALQTALEKRIGCIAAIIVSALLFTIFHADAQSLIPRFILGALFGYITWRTGTIAITIILHMLNNTIALIAMHYNLDMLETYGTGDTWYLSAAGIAISIWALSKIALPCNDAPQNDRN